MKPMPFTAFCAKVLRLRLTNRQRVLALVCIDGVEPEQLDEADRAIAHELFGAGVDTIPPTARRVQTWSLGRGSGKSTMAAAMMVHAAVTSDLTKIGPGMTGAAVALAPRQSTARLVVQVARALVRSVPALERLVVKGDDSKEGFSLHRDGRTVRIASFAASRGGINVRGFDVIMLLLDEAEFFGSGSDFAITDRDSYSACVPRLLPGADHHALFISTPWPVPTLMGELFEKNFGNPTTCLAALGTTIAMRDHDPEFAKFIASERERDPETADREWFCMREVAGTTGFYDPVSVDAAIDEDLLLPTKNHDDASLGIGMDLGLVRDSATLAVVGRRDEMHRVLALRELRPEKKKALKLSEVIHAFADELAPFGASEISADGWCREPAREYLEARGLSIVDAPSGANAKAETHIALRKLFREGRIAIPNVARLTAQLKSVVSKPVHGGGIRIDIPRRVGLAHGDLVSGLVLAAWQCQDGGMLDYGAAMKGLASF